MPVMDGIAATRELCRRYPRARRPRIVGMTANATEEDRRQCEVAGMDDYLPKPVRPELLAAALRRASRLAAAGADDFSAEGLAEMHRLYEEEGARELVGAMAQDLPAQCAELDRGTATRDAALVRRAAHSLKSAARMVGAEELGALWERIERLSDASTLDDAIGLVPEAVVRHERLVSRLRRELEP
jgi:two-component system, sensor histidine kinase and response regulator